MNTRLPIDIAFVSAACVLLTTPAVAESPLAQPRWVTTHSLPAAEAHQAAAADEHFFYAISSTQVAKYDRHSGERRAISTGEAKHLNSGFLWEGRLYCAHSNYPQKPEVSEIKVLDIESMRLTTFKDFGNFGGSLTWSIRDGSYWWCNFARYGADNKETFLVKFDEQWRELSRWTYPPELIARLGRYSLSGGVFLKDELLVTGHDDPLLFRLTIPTTGGVLRFARTESIPFTGQGIAIDSATQGLVGIQRAKRMIIVAARQ